MKPIGDGDTTPSGFLALPPEIHQQIFSFLGRKHLAKLLQVSRALYLEVCPRIYRDLTIHVDDQDGITVTLRESKRVPRESREGAGFGRLERMMGSLSFRLGGNGAGRLSAGRSRPGDAAGSPTAPTTPGGLVGKLIQGKIGLGRPFRYGSRSSASSTLVTPLPDRFSYTTHLTLTSHNFHICDSLPPLLMPNLHTLRIIPAWQTFTLLDICYCNHYYALSRPCPLTLPCACPLLTALRPHRLIIGNEITGLEGTLAGLSLPSSVKEVVVYIGECSGADVPEPKWSKCWAPKIPASVLRLSLVFQPAEAYDGEEPWRYRSTRSFPDGKFPVEYLWTRLAEGVSGKASGVEIVGLELVDREWSGMEVEKAEEAIRGELQRTLCREGSPEEAAKSRAKGIVFTTRKEFDLRVPPRVKGDPWSEE